MRGNQLGSGLGILMFLIALGQHIFLLGLEQGIFADFGEVTVQAGLSAKGGDGGRDTTGLAHFFPFCQSVMRASMERPSWGSHFDLQPKHAIYPKVPPCRPESD